MRATKCWRVKLPKKLTTNQDSHKPSPNLASSIQKKSVAAAAAMTTGRP